MLSRDLHMNHVGERTSLWVANQTWDKYKAHLSFPAGIDLRLSPRYGFIYWSQIIYSGHIVELQDLYRSVFNGFSFTPAGTLHIKMSVKCHLGKPAIFLTFSQCLKDKTTIALSGIPWVWLGGPAVGRRGKTRWWLYIFSVTFSGMCFWTFKELSTRVLLKTLCKSMLRFIWVIECVSSNFVFVCGSLGVLCVCMCLVLMLVALVPACVFVVVMRLGFSIG